MRLKEGNLEHQDALLFVCAILVPSAPFETHASGFFTSSLNVRSPLLAQASTSRSPTGSDKDYAYANDDNDHEDDHEDDHGEDEYELSDEQAAEARGALLADIFALVATYTNVGEGDGGDQRLTREAFNALGKVLAAAGGRFGRRRRGLSSAMVHLGAGAFAELRGEGAFSDGDDASFESAAAAREGQRGGAGSLSPPLESLIERRAAPAAAADHAQRRRASPRAHPRSLQQRQQRQQQRPRRRRRRLVVRAVQRGVCGRAGPGDAASSKRAFAALKQGHYQLRAAWGATGQLSGIWLGLWASASGGAAQSASMFIELCRTSSFQ